MHLDDDDKHQLAMEQTAIERENRIYEAGRAPAFPVTKFDDPHTIGDVRGGLTVREYFAIKIMAGLVAGSGGEDAPTYARMAVGGADALIAELNK